MRFFLYEIVARIVAIYLFVDYSRKLWHGLVERKIGYVVRDGDFLSLLLDWVDWSKLVIYRDAGAGPVLDTNRPRDIYVVCKLLCCDIWLVAPKHLSIR
jgi:hypothetical protein